MLDTSRKVSVIITSYNRGLLLDRAIKSVIAQSYNNIEIIIVDDKSTDPETLKVLSYYSAFGKNIKVVINEENYGANFSRNVGIKLATGYFYTGLDDDDYFSSIRIETLIESYKDDLAFVCDNYYILRGERKHKRFYFSKMLSLEDLCFENKSGNQIFTSLEKIKSVGMFDVGLKRLQDQDMWLRLLCKYKYAKRINKCTYYMDVSHDVPRITSAINSALAYRVFYSKHRESMSWVNKVKNENRIQYLEGVNILRISFLLTPSFFFKKIIRFFL